MKTLMLIGLTCFMQLSLFFPIFNLSLYNSNQHFRFCYCFAIFLAFRNL